MEALTSIWNSNFAFQITRIREWGFVYVVIKGFKGLLRSVVLTLFFGGIFFRSLFLFYDNNKIRELIERSLAFPPTTSLEEKHFFRVGNYFQGLFLFYRHEFVLLLGRRVPKANRAWTLAEPKWGNRIRMFIAIDVTRDWFELYPVCKKDLMKNLW